MDVCFYRVLPTLLLALVVLCSLLKSLHLFAGVLVPFFLYNENGVYMANASVVGEMCRMCAGDPLIADGFPGVGFKKLTTPGIWFQQLYN